MTRKKKSPTPPSSPFTLIIIIIIFLFFSLYPGFFLKNIFSFVILSLPICSSPTNKVYFLSYSSYPSPIMSHNLLATSYDVIALVSMQNGRTSFVFSMPMEPANFPAGTL